MDNIEYAISVLKKKCDEIKQGNRYQELVRPKDDVISRYGRAFKDPSRLTADEFKSFLYFKNNHHWTGLYRKGLAAASNFDELKNALRVLLDENKPISNRFDDALSRIHGMGKALASAILLVVYPDKYGVWNNTSEEALKKLNIWPSIDRGDSIGKRYDKINKRLVGIANAIKVDLWTLDAIWWAVLSEEEGDVGNDAEINSINDSSLDSRFALERHLQDFIVDNWKSIFGEDWVIYSENGKQIGVEYPTTAGNIDILASNVKTGDWLVVELKRGKTSDVTMGQLLRYMGYVKAELAEQNQSVQGVIIAQEVDDRLRYATVGAGNKNISLKEYAVSFELRPVT